MITSMVGHIRRYRAAMWDLFLSAVGCFILRRCFRLIARGGDGYGTSASVCAGDEIRDPLAYVGAALILLAIAANQQPALMRAVTETHS